MSVTGPGQSTELLMSVAAVLTAANVDYAVKICWMRVAVSPWLAKIWMSNCCGKLLPVTVEQQRRISRRC